MGKELFVEATVDQLILRTLNDAKSAFAAFYFNDAGGFFETFRRAGRVPGWCADPAPSLRRYRRAHELGSFGRPLSACGPRQLHR